MSERTIPPEHQREPFEKIAFWGCRECDFETEDYQDALAHHHDTGHETVAWERRYIPSWADPEHFFPYVPERAKVYHESHKEAVEG